MTTHSLIPADRVNGTTVYDTAGQKLGKIEDVAIDKVSGHVAYAILSFGGFLGMGENYYPVPWSVLKYDVDKGGYIVPLDKMSVEKAPSFQPKELGGWNDMHARDDLYAYYAPYGATPFW